MALAGCQLVPQAAPDAAAGRAGRPRPSSRAGGAGPRLPPDETRNRVAVLVPLSGANAGVGQSIANAANLALLDTGGERIRITVYDTASGGAAAAANEALADGNGLFLGPLLADDVRAVAPVARRARRAGDHLLQRRQRRRQRRLSDGLHPRPVDRPGRRPSPARAARSASARSCPTGVYGRRAAQAMIAGGRGRRRPAGRHADLRRARPATCAPRRPGSTAQGGYDAVLIADGGRGAAAGGAVAPPGLAAAAAARHRIVGDRDRSRRQRRRFAAPGLRRRPTPMFNQLRTRYRARYSANPYRLASLGYDAVLLAVRIAANWRLGRAFPERALRDPAGFAGRRRRLPLRPRRHRRARARGARGDGDRHDRRLAGAARASTDQPQADHSGEPSRSRARSIPARTSARSRVGRRASQQALARRAARPRRDRRRSSASAGERRDRARGRRPRASRSPISSASIACSLAGSSAVSSAMPWPLRASAASQFSGLRWRWVARAAAAAVRAGADAGIGAVAPVSEIVAALLAGPGVVGDFVGGEAGRLGHRLGQLVERGASSGSARRQLAPRRHARRSACRARWSAGRARGGRCRSRAPGSSSAAQASLALAGQGVDQVEADPVERGLRGRRAPPGPSATSWARPRKRSASSSSDCRPSETRLTPAAARSAKRAASTEEGLASSVISMSGREAPMRRRPPRSAPRPSPAASARACRRRRRSRPSRRPGNASRLIGQVGEQRLAPRRLVDRLADMAVEVAIGAFGDAERPVDVEGERSPRSVIPAEAGISAVQSPAPSTGMSIPAFAGMTVGGVHSSSAATSLRNASARWLIACFSAGSISPKVLSWPAGTNIGS